MGRTGYAGVNRVGAGDRLAGMIARRSWLARWYAAGLMVLVLTSGGCAADGSNAASGDPVLVYVQNLTDDPVEFMFLPVGASPWTMDARPQMTVAAGCARVPAGWQLVRVEPERPPADPHILGLVAHDAAGDAPQTVWISVTDGAVTQGEGVPDWWTEDVQVCSN
jgi:hypothetical protein